jgi:putative membrane protein
MNAAELTALTTRVKAITRPEPALLWLYAISALPMLCAWPIAMVPLYFRYHTLWYRFGDEGLAMGVGILFRREQQLTYARMQDIHVSQNLLERWLGIGTVTVQTAGAGAGGNLTIVGVRDVEAVRDFLYAKLRGVRHDAEARPAAQAPAADAVLVEIRDALTAAAKALEAKR